MTHNMKIKYPLYISENPFIYSLFHTAGFVSHSVKYVSYTVVFVFHSVKQRICLCNSKNMNRQTDIPLLIRKRIKIYRFSIKYFCFSFTVQK